MYQQTRKPYSLIIALCCVLGLWSQPYVFANANESFPGTEDSHSSSCLSEHHSGPAAVAYLSPFNSISGEQNFENELHPRHHFFPAVQLYTALLGTLSQTGLRLFSSAAHGISRSLYLLYCSFLI